MWNNYNFEEKKNRHKMTKNIQSNVISNFLGQFKGFSVTHFRISRNAKFAFLLNNFAKFLQLWILYFLFFLFFLCGNTYLIVVPTEFSVVIVHLHPWRKNHWFQFNNHWQKKMFYRLELRKGMERIFFFFFYKKLIRNFIQYKKWI